MQIDVNEEYSLYFTKYSDKASKAMEAMESLLQHSHTSKEKTPRWAINHCQWGERWSILPQQRLQQGAWHRPHHSLMASKESRGRSSRACSSNSHNWKRFWYTPVYIGLKFSGQEGYWPEFLLRWQLADDAMAAVCLTFPQRFLLLLQMLEGIPLEYVRNPPVLKTLTSLQLKAHLHMRINPNIL